MTIGNPANSATIRNPDDRVPMIRNPDDRVTTIGNPADMYDDDD